MTCREVAERLGFAVAFGWRSGLPLRNHPVFIAALAAEGASHDQGQITRCPDEKSQAPATTAHERARYRCFLPDLAGLAGKRRAEPMPDSLYYQGKCLGTAAPGRPAGRSPGHCPALAPTYSRLVRDRNLSIRRKTASTGTGNFPQADFWPGIAFGSPVIERHSHL